MDWYLIRYFLAVAELGNFSKAAAKMNVTQPTLSVGIVKLETILGQKLFDRDKRRTTLTLAGSKFLVHARRIVHDYELALSDISQTTRREKLRVGVLSTIPNSLLEAAVSEYLWHKQTPNLEIIEGSEKELRERLETNRIDAALTILSPNTKRFESESLGWEDYVLIAPKQHRFAKEAVMKGEAFAEDVMIIRRHCEVLAATSRYFTQRGVRPGFGLKTTSDDRALALVRAGLGVTVMAESFYDPEICQIRLVDFDLRREIGLVFPAHAHSRYDTTFTNALKRSFDQARNNRSKWRK